MTRLLPFMILAFLVSCEAMPVRAIRQPVLVPVLHEQEEKYQHVGTWGFQAQGVHEQVPNGLIVDGASVPRFAWCFMSPDGLHRAAALAHDWTYILRGHLRNGVVLTREQADQQFYDHMIECGIERWRAGTAYRCVRLGGWAAWNSLESPIILPVDPNLMASPHRKRLIPHLYAR